MAFYHWDAAGSTSVSDNLDLGPEWADDREGRRTSINNKLSINDSGGSIDPEPMAKLVQSVAVVLAEALR
ncbi:hypothetical protein MKK75_08190 [Methylobacterium sp. J-030]|uniref:hypothetical protein n=1 Tax=Methylobacterium sp. J-030 TaxID=2836627 RepID=UPI001FB94B2B|nr:hypothetical protein [Methylobacterium sp. J-030]MCJ2068780.1 hypothetical protein [Methylobacterium sp. J-030]